MNVSRNINSELEREIAFLKKRLEKYERSESRHAGSLIDYDENIKAILHSIVDFIFGFDKDGRFIFAHTPKGKKYMMPPEDFIGKRHDEVLPANICTEFEKAFKMNSKGKHAEYEYSIDEGGKEEWFLTRMSPFIINGNNIGSIAVVRDITEYKKNEEILRVKEQLHRSINDSISDYAFSLRIIDKEHMSFEWVTELHPAISRFTLNIPYSLEFLLKPVSEENRDNIRQTYSRLINEETKIETEFKFKVGRITRIFIARFQSLKNEKGEINRIIGAAQDISERKRMEEHLKESEQRFRSMFENSPIASQSLDHKGRILYVNSMWTELTGYSNSEIAGKSFSDFIAEDDRNKFHERFKKAFESDCSKPEILDIVCKDGKIVTVRISGKIFSDKLTGNKHIYCVLKNITEKQQAFEEISKLNTALINSKKFEAAGHLAGGIAHEFNNVLTAILSNTELMESDLDNEDLKVYTAKIKESVEYAAGLTSQLLFFAREKEPVKDIVSVHGMIERVAGLINSIYKGSVNVHYALEAERHCIVSDEMLLQSVLLNVGLNTAAEFEDMEAEVMYSTKNTEDGESLIVTIEYTYSNVHRKRSMRILEPAFYPEDKPGFATSGIYDYIRQIGGTVNIVNNEDTAQIELTMPAADNPDAVIDKMAGAVKKIMIVDDETRILDVTTKILEKEGYIVDAFSSGLHAVEKFKEEGTEYSLIILDMIMPEMNGMELFEKMKGINSEVRTIICSGYSEEGNAKSLLEKGADAFLQKPYRKNVLLDKIKTVLS